MIGVGLMGHFYSRVLAQMPSVELVGVCGRSEERTSGVSGELGVPGFADEQYVRMLEEVGPVDGVIIATPEDAHLDPVRAALAADADLLVEKPLGGNAREAAEIVRLASDYGKSLMVCHHLRFDPRYAVLARRVQQGELGDIVNVYARRNPPVSSARRIGGRVPSAYWVGVHDIDLVHWITGQRVVKVFAKAAGARLGDLGVDDCVVSTCTLADGSLFVLENSWATVSTQGNPRSSVLAIRGTAGIGEVEASEHGLSIYTADAALNLGAEVAVFPEIHGRLTGMYADMIEHFVASAVAGTAPAVSGTDGWAAVLVADAIIESLRQDREVVVEWP